ncbi:hypothetical protein [Pelotalea chapellei]|uniref:Uncharacterized protein n=1 Tax=Pelotalea chapellei TaxID=44671 RepID=A0ABS5U5L5_9BACT|nr:hypothetical protein [Pelotalea chapellei]MBT1070960.1 hypothetical protein [Pelotalea chapellei]
MKTTTVFSSFCIVTALGMTAQADTSCRVIEYPDHYEAVCNGDEKVVPSISSPLVIPATPSKSKKSGAKPEVRKIITYRLNRPIKTGWNDKLAIRMKLIKEEQEKQRQEAETAPPEPEQREDTISDSSDMNPM